MRTTGMSPVLCVESPPSSPPASIIRTPGTSTSKFRSIFDWHKPSNGSLRPSTRSSEDPVSKLPFSMIQHRRPALSSRAGSERSVSSAHDRPRSAESKVSRVRDRMIIDPPPLAQVHRQAILQARLETPVSFIEKNRRGGHTSKDQHTRGLSEDKIEVKRSHKKTESGESTCDTRSKMFFLVNGPYVLQYEGDSNGDALPDKILVLNRESVAIACDAVPGRPWVLQISKPLPDHSKIHGSSLKPSWSKMTLRQPEDRRAVNTLLLVFDDSEELYTWLFAVRKEIENLGGLEYNPNGEDDQAWRDNLTQRYAVALESQQPLRKISAARANSTQTSPESSRRRQETRGDSRMRSKSIRSSGSSKATSTSLDRFRDSVASDGYTSTLATSCADGSASSISPVYETFSSLKSVAPHAPDDLSLRAYTTNNDVSPRLSTSPKPARSLWERRKASLNSLNLAGREEVEDTGRKHIIDLPATISGSPNDAPLPAPSTENGSMIVSNEDATTKTSRRQLSRNVSSSGSVPKAKYSLFPVCPSSEPKDEPLVSPTVLVQPMAIPKIIETQHEPKPDIHPVPGIRHQKSRSRTVTLELRQHRVSALLGAGEFAQPQRSPAVTDDMIMSNFGTSFNKSPASPVPDIRVPGLHDLKFDLDFLRAPYRAPSKAGDSVSRNSRTSSVRSVSNSRHERSTSVAKAPAGPPPAGPLPEVPPESQRTPRTNKLSQQSQRIQNGTSDQQDVNESFAGPRILFPTMVATSPTNTLTHEHRTERHGRMTSAGINGAALSYATHISNTNTKNYRDDESTSRSRSRSRGRPRLNKP